MLSGGDLTMRRHGFVLMFVLVSIAVLAILATLVVPSTVRILNEERITKAQTSFVRLDSAIVRFRRTLDVYPGRLNHLAVEPTTNDKNSCGVNYETGQLNKWAGSATDTTGGAYIAQAVPPSGLPLAGGIGSVRDSISRNPPPPDSSGVIELVVANVAEDDAILLNDRIDGIADYVTANAVNGNQTGKIRWTPPTANRFVTVTYNLIPPEPRC